MTAPSTQPASLLNPVILVIDDDGDFWADGVTTLIRGGYDVLTARSRREAQSLCEVSSIPIHLVILDIPFEPRRWIEGMDPRHYGTTLVAMIRATRPSSPIVLTSPTPAWKVSRHRLGPTLWQFPRLPHSCCANELLDTITALLSTDPGTPPPCGIPMRHCA